MVELIVILLMGLLELSVAIVLSAGLERTCSAFKKSAVENLPYVIYRNAVVLSAYYYIPQNANLIMLTEYSMSSMLFFGRCSLYHLEFPDNTSTEFYGNLITAKVSYSSPRYVCFVPVYYIYYYI